MRKKILAMVMIMAMVSGLAFAAGGDQDNGAGKAGEAKMYRTPNSCGWTNDKFAGFLAGKFGIKAPEGLSTGDTYKALANALSQRGVPYFLTAQPDVLAKCCDAVTVLYSITGVKDKTASCDIQYNSLVKDGYVKPSTPDADPCDALCDIEKLFSGPLVIERFSAVPPTTLPNPPERTPERPSSRV